MMTAPRLPTEADVKSSQLNVLITPPFPPTTAPANVLVLLHGLGDTAASSAIIARQLNLRETVCLSVQAPTPLPFDLGGFHWGDDILFDHATGNIDPDAGFTRAATAVKQHVVQEVCIGKCGFREREVLFFGLGQGGMVALAVAAASTTTTTSSATSTQNEAASTGEYGGIISLGGPLSTGAPSSAQRNETPVLLLGGSSATTLTRSSIDRTKLAFTHVEYHCWPSGRSGDGMPRNRDEMMPVMRFLGRRLRSRAGVPESSVELR